MYITIYSFKKSITGFTSARILNIDYSMYLTHIPSVFLCIKVLNKFMKSNLLVEI